MNSKTVLIVSCFAVLLGEQVIASDEDVPKLYEEIGCTIIDNSTSFECPDFASYSTDKCYLGGKTFNVNDTIDESVLPSCRASCKCVQYGNESAYINCANVECPEDQNRDWSCVSQYDDLKQCCRSREICDKDKLRTIQKCELDGKSYHIGERFNPDNSCYECLCSEDFDNKIPLAQNSHCAKINCGIELERNKLQNGCIPVYYKTPTCCPIDYKCPSKEDEIESPNSQKSHMCYFGALTLKYGEKLKSNDKCLKCECRTPPYITCIKSDC